MDSNIDAASEALIRKLHRELNGLTRSTRGGDRAAGGSRPSMPPLRTKPVQELGNARPQISDPSPFPPPRRKSVQADSFGSEASSSGSEDKEEAKPPPKKQRKQELAQEPRNHKVTVKQQSPARSLSLAPDVKKDHPPDSSRKQHDKEPVSDVGRKLLEKAQDQSKFSSGPAEGRGAADAPAAAATATAAATAGPPPAPPSTRTPAAAAPPPPPAPPQAPAIAEHAAPASSHPAPAAAPASAPAAAFKSPLEAAAAAASTIVKDKVKLMSSGGRGSEGQRLIKCFHAGVRWGISLAPDAIKARSDLATALNDAFAGEILSCGRGDILNIVFLARDGRVTEFPSLRSSGARDSASKWKLSVDTAVKIYVRRG